MNRKALFSGSFDPPTIGHIDIIKRASAIFDSLTVALVANINKETYFDVEERMDMLKIACEDIDNVDFVYVQGLLADYVNKNDIDVVIRGLRDTKDFQYELEMAQYNANLYERAETIFLMTSAEYSYISSSGVREIIALNGNIREFVTDSVYKYIQNRRK